MKGNYSKQETSKFQQNQQSLQRKKNIKQNELEIKLNAKRQDSIKQKYSEMKQSKQTNYQQNNIRQNFTSKPYQFGEGFFQESYEEQGENKQSGLENEQEQSYLEKRLSTRICEYENAFLKDQLINLKLKSDAQTEIINDLQLIIKEKNRKLKELDLQILNYKKEIEQKQHQQSLERIRQQQQQQNFPIPSFIATHQQEMTQNSLIAVQAPEQLNSNDKQQEFIFWACNDTYTMDIFSKYNGLTMIRRKYQLHIIPYHKTEEILSYYINKFNFALENLLIFNYHKVLSIIYVTFHEVIQQSQLQFKCQFNSQCILVSELPNKQILMNIEQFSFKFYEEPYFKVKGISTRYDQFAMRGMGFCFIYNDVDDFDQFVNCLQDHCDKIKQTKQNSIIINYNECEQVIVILLVSDEIKTYIIKDFFLSVKNNTLNQFLILKHKTDIQRIKQLIVRKEDIDARKIQWITPKDIIYEENEQQKLESFNTYIEAYPIVEEQNFVDDYGANIFQDSEEQGANIQ